MLAAYRQAFAKVAQDLGLVPADALAPYLLPREAGPLDQTLVSNGLLRALDVERVFVELARRLDQRDPTRLARRADLAVAELLGEDRILEAAELARLVQEHQRALRPEAPVPLLAFLGERGALAPEQRAKVRARLSEIYVACTTCGTHVKRAGTSATRCAECGMPLAVAPAIEDPLLGRVLGNCRLERKIGQGGMGAVYLARHEIMDNLVAVKILPPQVSARPELRERFEREARLAAKLTHPGVVQVLDLGCEGGIHFIAMEFVAGESVAARVARSPFTADAAVRIARDVALALEHAHQAGLVHRDIKPDNLLLRPDGRVVVADFGLARAVEGTPLSMTGEVLGTPAYMAPEQARGETVDARADIYALGVTLYAMLLGRSPFERGSPMATLLAVCDEPVPPLGRAVPGVPISLQGLVGQMAAKKPGLRPQTMGDVVLQLERVLAELDGRPAPAPVRAIRPASGQAAARPSQRPPSGRAGARPHTARAGALTPPRTNLKPAIGLLAVGLAAWALWPRASEVADPPPREVVTLTPPTPPPVVPEPPRPPTIEERVRELEDGELAKRNHLVDRLAYLDGLVGGVPLDPAYGRALVSLRDRLVDRARADAIAGLTAALAPLFTAHAYGDAAAAIERDVALKALPSTDAMELGKTWRDIIDRRAVAWYAAELAFLDAGLQGNLTPKDTAALRARVLAIPTHGLTALEAARREAGERIGRAERELERQLERTRESAARELEEALAAAYDALERGALTDALARFAALVASGEAREAALADARGRELERMTVVEAAWRAHVTGLAARSASAPTEEIALVERTIEGRVERVDLVKGQLVVRRRSGSIEVGVAVAFAAIAPRQRAAWAVASKAPSVDPLALAVYLIRSGDPKAARPQLARAPAGDDKERYLALIDRPAGPRVPDKPLLPPAERVPDQPPLPPDPVAVAPGRSVRVRYDLAKPEAAWAELAFRRRPPSSGCPGGAYCRPEAGAGLHLRNGTLVWRAPHGVIERVSVQVSIVARGDGGRVALRLGGRSLLLPTEDGGASHLSRIADHQVDARAGWWKSLVTPRWVTLEATPEPRPRLSRALVGEEEIHLVDAAGADTWEFLGGRSTFEIEASGETECVIRAVWVIARWTRPALTELQQLRARARRCVRPTKVDHELCPFPDDDDIHTRWQVSREGEGRWWPIPVPAGFALRGNGHGRYITPAEQYERRTSGYYLVRARPGECATLGFQLFQEVKHENAKRGLILPTTDVAQDCEGWWRGPGDLEVWVDGIPQDWHPDNSDSIRWPPTEDGLRTLVLEAERGDTTVERVTIGSPAD